MSALETGPIACGEVRALLAAFLADEIAADESRRVQAHLDACEGCRRYREFERAFDLALARACPKEAAPASLIVRVHEALNREDAGARGWRRVVFIPAWRAWAVAAAAAILVLLPSILSYRAGLGVRVPAGSDVVNAGKEQILQGTLVCSECERQGVPTGSQRGCRAFGHHTAFKCEKTGIWDFVESDTTRALLTDADHVGERLEVRGVFMKDLHYVKVSTYRYLPGPPQPDSGM